MNIDIEKAAEIGLAVMALTQHSDQAGCVRAWKGIDWDLLDVMHQRGWIGNPVGKAKSVQMTESGLSVAQTVQAQYLQAEPSLEDLLVLEEGMWTYSSRSDPAWFDAHIHTDFVEVGRSGTRYVREGFFPVQIDVFKATIPLPCYEVRRLSPGCALTTYTSEIHGNSGIERAHRASTWVYEDARWQLLYHQGTAYRNDV